MTQARYFELLDHIGVEPDYITDPKTGEPVANKAAGELQPLQHETVNVSVPTMVGNELIPVAQGVTVNAIPGTRILKIEDPLIANVIGDLGKYREIDPPDQGDLKKSRKETEAARQDPEKKEQ